MNRIHIFLHNVFIESHEFNDTFCIIKDAEGLYWYPDLNYPSQRKGGTYQILIQDGRAKAKIMYILPDWQISIDGETLPAKFYHDIDIVHSKTRLFHEEYSFHL